MLLVALVGGLGCLRAGLGNSGTESLEEVVIQEIDVLESHKTQTDVDVLNVLVVLVGLRLEVNVVLGDLGESQQLVELGNFVRVLLVAEINVVECLLELLFESDDSVSDSLEDRNSVLEFHETLVIRSEISQTNLLVIPPVFQQALEVLKVLSPKLTAHETGTLLSPKVNSNQ